MKRVTLAIAVVLAGCGGPGGDASDVPASVNEQTQPAASVTESACQCAGDDRCTFELRWH